MLVDEQKTHKEKLKYASRSLSPPTLLMQVSFHGSWHVDHKLAQTLA